MTLSTQYLENLATQIKWSDTPIKVAIYEFVKNETNNFKTYPPLAAGYIDIIRLNGRQAQIASNLKSLCNRASSFVKAHPQTTIFSSFAIGGGILASVTTAPAWVGLAGGIALYAAGRAIFSSCSHRTVAKQNRTDNRILRTPPQLHNLEEKKLEKNPKCPISMQEIPPGQEIIIDNTPYDINHFVAGVLAMEANKPLNPVNRQPLKDAELTRICRYFNIPKAAFLNLFNEEAQHLAQGMTDHEIQQLGHLSEQEQIDRTIENENRLSDRKRDIKKEFFIQLLLANNTENSPVVQNFLFAVPQ